MSSLVTTQGKFHSDLFMGDFNDCKRRERITVTTTEATESQTFRTVHFYNNCFSICNPYVFILIKRSLSQQKCSTIIYRKNEIRFFTHIFTQRLRCSSMESSIHRYNSIYNKLHLTLIVINVQLK